MARFFTDENFPFPIVRRLEELGHVVVTLQDTGLAASALPDSDILNLAIQRESVLVTLNRRHFIRLHELHPEHWGIIVCTFDPDFDGCARRIDRTVRAAGPMKGRLLRIRRSN